MSSFLCRIVVPGCESRGGTETRAAYFVPHLGAAECQGIPDITLILVWR